MQNVIYRRGADPEVLYSRGKLIAQVEMYQVILSVNSLV